MKENYEILLNDNLWILYPKCRDGLEDAMEEVYDRIADGMDKDDFRIVYSQYDAEGKLTQRYDVVDVDWGEVDEDRVDESMDGDFDSGMASAGFGTDEDYGCFGDETYGADF
tara:strand:+ start:272 stop:607 length:336 start_codon:yes stop_codon:yes gene_type:complete